MAAETFKNALRVVAGSEVVVDVLTWDEGWDFDYPACVLRPVVRFSPNGSHPEDMVEDLAGDLARGTVPDRREVENGMVDRQFFLTTLQARWAANRRGITYPVKQYCASRYRVRFALDTDPDADTGDLTWTVEPVASPSAVEKSSTTEAP